MELIEGRDLRTATAQAVARDLPCPIPVAAYIIARGRGRARLRASQDRPLRRRAQHRALRRLAVERDAVDRRLRQDPRLRDRARDVRERARAPALARQAALHGARADARRAADRPRPTCSRSASSRGSCSPGLPLYRGPDLKSILEAVRRTVPPRLDRLNPDVPKEIVDAVEKALSREPPRSRHRGGSPRGVRADRDARRRACTRAVADRRSTKRTGARLPAISIHDSLSVQRASTSVPPRSAAGARGRRSRSMAAAVPAQIAERFRRRHAGVRGRRRTVLEPPARTTTGSPFVGFEHDGTTTSASERPWGRAPTTRRSRSSSAIAIRRSTRPATAQRDASQAARWGPRVDLGGRRPARRRAARARADRCRSPTARRRRSSSARRTRRS